MDVSTAVLVQPPWSQDSSTTLGLASAARLVFGRGAPGLPVDLTLPDEGVSRRAGFVTAALDHWSLTNLSPRTTYVVENLEGAGEHIKVPPRRYQAPIPFELSEVVLPAGEGTVRFKVYALAPAFLAPDQVDAVEQGEPTLQAFPLDTTAKYFLVLVALCEPRLRGRSVAIPTVEQVAARLRALPGCANLTGRAVDGHIEYLARDKLRLRRSGGGQEDGFAARRETLVTFALRFGLVRDEHLAALPERHRA